MSSFTLRIVTPDGAHVPRRVRSLDVPAETGRMTVLAGHQPVLCWVRPGVTVLVDDRGVREAWRNGQGVLRVRESETDLIVKEAGRN